VLAVKNFNKFQHYKDRNPPWIKLHVSLLKDYEFSSLPDAAKSHLMSIWILASMMENRIPNDPEWIERQINSTEPIDLDLLIETGFLIETEDPPEVKEKWPSRYVSDVLKAQVLERAGHKCECCGATENLEIDHIIPVSKGGKSVLENLQVLCRRCNRKKRQRSTSAEQLATQIPGIAAQVATQTNGTRAGPATRLRSPEAEAEAEAEAEKEAEAAAEAEQRRQPCLPALPAAAAANGFNDPHLSVFAFAEIEDFVRETKPHSTNPGGLARRLWRSGEEDTAIGQWKETRAGPIWPAWVFDPKEPGTIEEKKRFHLQLCEESRRVEAEWKIAASDAA
jgi:hypothetical protein